MANLCARWLWLVVVFVLCGPALADEPKALKGVALVIGQAKYQQLTPLLNPANDAKAVAGLFTDLGFNVTATADRDAKKLRRDLENFAADAEGADVAVIYYSGHGIEAGGENWLVPVDSDATSLDSAEKSLVPLSTMLEELRATVPLTLVFLDACRTNPFPAGALLKAGDASLPVSAGGLSLAKGVVAADGASGPQGLGSVIGFAAEPGHVALDGPADGNSPYAAALLRHLSASTGTEFGTVMRMVTEEVYLKTQGAQRSWVNETLTRLLYFGGKAEDTASENGRLNAGRRDLLLTIDGLDSDLRRTVEQLAKDNGLPLDPIYGMLKQLQVDTSKGPEELDKQLRAGVEAVKKLKAERDTITRTDPEIIKYTELGDRAEAEGAIPLARDYRAKASARAKEISKALKAEERNIKARHLEVAATFAKEAETATVAFDFKTAAENYRLAFAEVETQDVKRAREYKWGEADALQEHGYYKGDNGALEESIVAYDVAIKLVQRESDRQAWGRLQSLLGRALRTLGERESGTVRLEESVSTYRLALKELARDRVPLDWAQAQQNLGTALWMLGERETGTVRLEEAVATLRSALGGLEREQVPQFWAEAQVNLGNALSALGEREGNTSRLEEAEVAYRAALEETTRERAPLDWAMMRSNLGAILWRLDERENNTARLEEALANLRLALEERTREREPLGWAATLNNLALVLSDLGERENSTARLEEAIAAYRLALEERTREREPLGWAATQHNLGATLEDLGKRENSTARLEEAIAAYRLALQERTREAVPLDWAATQNNLGNALVALGERESDTVRLEEAVVAYRAAIEEWTRERVPLDWARAQVNLGSALNKLAYRKTGKAKVEMWLAVVEAWGNAQKLFDKEKAPIKWASAQNSIGYTMILIGEEENNPARYELAIQMLREAFFVQQQIRDQSLPFTADSLCHAVLDLGVAKKDQGMLAEARGLCESAIDGERKLGDEAAVKETQGNLARIDAALAELKN